MARSADTSIEVLARASEQLAEVLAGVSRDRLSDPTPCDGWDVAGLIAHVVAGPHRFIAMGRGEQPDWSATPPLPDDWTEQFRAGAADLLDSWRRAGDGAPAQMMDWQTAELAVHTWDLATATGQPTDLDPEVAQRGLDFMTGALTTENRGSAFGPAVSLPDDAPIYDRLAAFAGRDPR